MYTLMIELPDDMKAEMLKFKHEWRRRKGSKDNYPEILPKLIRNGMEVEKRKWKMADQIINS